MIEEKLPEFDYDFFYDSMKDYKWFFLDDKGDPEFYHTVTD